jgi:hypothetical protein
MREWKHSYTNINPERRHSMGVSGQLHAPGVLPPGIDPQYQGCSLCVYFVYCVSFDCCVILYDVCYLCVVSYCSTTATG